MDKFQTTEIGHGRIEKRTVYTFPRHDYLRRYIPVSWLNLIKEIILVKRERKVLSPKGKNSTWSIEYSYYLSSENMGAKRAYEVTRKHWRIENTQNYVRDEIMEEDKSRIRKKPLNMFILRSLALNVLRAKGVENIKQTLYKNSLNIENTLLFIGLHS